MNNFKKILLALALISLFSCKAQVVAPDSNDEVIIPMSNTQAEIPDNAYLKDTTNELNKYIGTWKYQSGNESLTIILDKFLHYDFDAYFKDILIGEYKYVDATGATIINSLPDMTDSAVDPLEHNISSAVFIHKGQYPKCSECGVTEFRIKSFFEDPERPMVPMAIVFRYISPTQIKAKIVQAGNSLTLEGEPSEIRIPFFTTEGFIEYTLNKI
ncbi:DUF6705 family protein [Flavobacterium aquatile]|uniref:DUF6705 domain-containing protein n=1 Tax=Flavobacterium aquatile LMG 4008 = ATCC 11947 TaxID=1453498 RepID=A0A095V0U5_9FLAO|nr:DUF6705 family protein [Flavobacterium aquatile]KGD68485.1 hypothetical protein LG45_09415 [Flavobacterium aquatile LMG 4008 = ATCC 11947]OXA68586.1 hypothetical protein B0A61_02425 [Flavobacterium aquatile LMG 4008 = ATCC 11947]GEC79467.1 hypothetical protein FAQ01_23370 [Flavobacterium aquatile]